MTAKVFVVFKRGNEVVTKLEKESLVEAEKVARILNDGLQEKAKAAGFRYVVEVNEG